MQMKKLKLPLLFLGIFYSIAIWRYLATGKAFYLVNFGYIGTALALGIFLFDALPREKFGLARRLSQVLIGAYMLGYVGLVGGENMQIEGFWFYLFSGVFAGATLHYFIAKIAGPFVFSRGWCGWACWTAMFLDLLPWKKPARPTSKPWMRLRYLHFFMILAAAVYIFFVLGDRSAAGDRSVELAWLLAGNVAYYAVGLSLAAILKDNRAFCKYLCPIAVFMKVGARFSLMKIRIDADKCVDCKLCEKSCPMQVPITAYKDRGGRVASTECVLCFTCTKVCPQMALDLSSRPGRCGLTRRGGR
jgi:polyferredoxin